MICLRLRLFVSSRVCTTLSEHEQLCGHEMYRLLLRTVRLHSAKEIVNIVLVTGYNVSGLKIVKGAVNVCHLSKIGFYTSYMLWIRHHWAVSIFYDSSTHILDLAAAHCWAVSPYLSILTYGFRALRFWARPTFRNACPGRFPNTVATLGY